MYKRTLIAAALGLILGVVITQALHFERDSGSAKAFENKLRCKTLAEEYVRQNSSARMEISIDRMDYSPSLRTCVASVFEQSGTDFNYQSYRVIDVLSSKLLFSGSCKENNESDPIYCGNGRNNRLLEEREAAFEKAVKNPLF